MFLGPWGIAAREGCTILSDMIRIGSILMAIIVLLAPEAGRADWSQRHAAEAGGLVQRFLQRREGVAPPSALSVAIGVDGKLVFAEGYGEARPGVPATARTVYHIGSLTKQFTAAAMLKLIESGVRAPLSRQPIGLDTPLRDIFEGTERWGAADQPPVTVRSLLTMTSNLPNFTREPPRGADPWGAVEVPQLIAALKNEVPRGWPNTFEYSNTGYFLIAQIIEASLRDDGGGRLPTAREYVREMLLRPAGMALSGFVGDYAPDSVIALPQYRRRPAFTQPHWLDGCADMASSAVDLFAWDKALMEGRLISVSSRDAMFSDAARVDPLTYYGMGWYVRHEDRRDSYYHSGSVPGFTSYNAIERTREDGEWISVTLLTNSDGIAGLDQLADDIFGVARDRH
jgi:D-alanyl-D-alanine carboxypeptidase